MSASRPSQLLFTFAKPFSAERAWDRVLAEAEAH
jgi:hypothetical protein